MNHISNSYCRSQTVEPRRVSKGPVQYLCFCGFPLLSGDKSWTRAFLYLGQPPPSCRDRTKKEGRQTSLPRAEFEPASPISTGRCSFAWTWTHVRVIGEMVTGVSEGHIGPVRVCNWAGITVSGRRRSCHTLFEYRPTISAFTSTYWVELHAEPKLIIINSVFHQSRFEPSTFLLTSKQFISVHSC